MSGGPHGVGTLPLCRTRPFPPARAAGWASPVRAAVIVPNTLQFVVHDTGALGNGWLVSFVWPHSAVTLQQVVTVTSGRGSGWLEVDLRRA